MTYEKFTNPDIPTSFTHRRLKDLVHAWLEGVADPEVVLGHAFELRDYVASHFEEAKSRETGSDVEESIMGSVRRALELHLESCTALITALEENHPEDSDIVLSLAADGDLASHQANEEANEYRAGSGITG